MVPFQGSCVCGGGVGVLGGGGTRRLSGEVCARRAGHCRSRSCILVPGACRTYRRGGALGGAGCGREPGPGVSPIPGVAGPAPGCCLIAGGAAAASGLSASWGGRQTRPLRMRTAHPGLSRAGRSRTIGTTINTWTLKPHPRVLVEFSRLKDLRVLINACDLSCGSHTTFLLHSVPVSRAGCPDLRRFQST